MSEEELEIDIKEQIKKLEEEGKELPWNKYMSLTTAIVAVVAALASLASGSYSNEAVIEKNNAILFQNKASDQWSYYQAKGVKKNIADSFYTEFQVNTFKKQADQYQGEQVDIKKQAENFQYQVETANQKSEMFLEKHHKTAFSVTFFQIAIAFAALSALMKRRLFFYFSLVFTVIGIVYLILGLL